MEESFVGTTTKNNPVGCVLNVTAGPDPGLFYSEQNLAGLD